MCLERPRDRRLLRGGLSEGGDLGVLVRQAAASSFPPRLKYIVYRIFALYINSESTPMSSEEYPPSPSFSSPPSRGRRRTAAVAGAGVGAGAGAGAGAQQYSDSGSGSDTTDGETSGTTRRRERQWTSLTAAQRFDVLAERGRDISQATVEIDARADDLRALDARLRQNVLDFRELEQRMRKQRAALSGTEGTDDEGDALFEEWKVLNREIAIARREVATLSRQQPLQTAARTESRHELKDLRRIHLRDIGRRRRSSSGSGSGSGSDSGSDSRKSKRKKRKSSNSQRKSKSKSKSSGSGQR